MSPRGIRWCLGLVLLMGCRGPKEEPPVTIFAAVSTQEALQEVAEGFKAQTGTPVDVNGAASSTLAKQIEQGANADLFLSADEDWADYLQKAGLVAERRDLLNNGLVVVVPRDSTAAIQELSDLAKPAFAHLALAAPPVPAGHYAREALTRAGVWDQVKDRVRQGGDVRAALAYVVRGEAEAGLVYYTDALSSPGVKVALKVKPDLHAPIRYPLVLIQRQPISATARSFYEYLHGDEAAQGFRRHGFEVVP